MTNIMYASPYPKWLPTLTFPEAMFGCFPLKQTKKTVSSQRCMVLSRCPWFLTMPVAACLLSGGKTLLGCFSSSQKWIN